MSTLQLKNATVRSSLGQCANHQPNSVRAVELLEGIGSPDCAKWRAAIFRRYEFVALALARKYKLIAQQKDFVAANVWLRETTSSLKLGGTGLSLFGTQEELDDYAKAKAAKTHRQIYEAVDTAGKDLAPDIIRSVVERAGVDFPLPSVYSTEQLVGAMARASEPKWWKLKLRPKQWREAEDFIRSTGVVHKTEQIYLSDFSLKRRLGQKSKNAELLKRMEAENEQGKVYTLSELAALSPSNPLIRRAELMVRLNGSEKFAEASESLYQGVCFTLTCPSKFHPTHSYGEPNSKYDGSTVSQAQDYLNTVWGRTRSAFARAGINVFGMRVAEPQQDGTPHWHILLFIEKEHLSNACNIFRHYALEVDGDEAGAKEHRLDVLLIDRTKGTATGYLAKYIAKNIDGEGIDTDSYGKNAVTSAIRVEAWASIHGIRQFQQIGGASITVWRELRRLEGQGVDEGLLKSLTEAADESDWARYTELMGGMNCRLKERPVRPMMIERQGSNLYGELVTAIKGLWLGAKPVVTRIHEWSVRLVREHEGEDLESVGAVEEGANLIFAHPPDAFSLEFCQ